MQGSPRDMPSQCTNGLKWGKICSRKLLSSGEGSHMVPCQKMSVADWRAFSVAVPSAWNSLADYIHDSCLS